MQLLHDPDALTALIALEPARASRNRHFAFFANAEGRAARRRAFALRGVVRELAGAFGPVRVSSFEMRGEIALIVYALPRIGAVRTVRLTASDLAVARVALARRNIRLLPQPLVAREEDHAIVARLVGHGEAALGRAPAHS